EFPEPPGSTTPRQNAQDSLIMGGAGKGEALEKKLKGLQDNWGNLPPEQRAQAINELSQEVPPKYQTAVKDHFKALDTKGGEPGTPDDGAARMKVEVARLKEFLKDGEKIKREQEIVQAGTDGGKAAATPVPALQAPPVIPALVPPVPPAADPRS